MLSRSPDPKTGRFGFDNLPAAIQKEFESHSEVTEIEDDISVEDKEKDDSR